MVTISACHFGGLQFKSCLRNLIFRGVSVFAIKGVFQVSCLYKFGCLFRGLSPMPTWVWVRMEEFDPQKRPRWCQLPYSGGNEKLDHLRIVCVQINPKKTLAGLSTTKKSARCHLLYIIFRERNKLLILSRAGWSLKLK